MKTLFTFLTLCSLTLFAVGCGETPNAADDAAGDTSESGAELGEATGEPDVSLGDEETPDEPPFAEDGAEAGSELEPFEEDGGPELPTPN